MGEHEAIERKLERFVSSVEYTMYASVFDRS